MIRVVRQSEPERFDRAVRQPGLAWLVKTGCDGNEPLPVKAPPFWRECLDDLHHCYHGICAYLAVYVERPLGGASVDHFIAKSRQAGLAYEWDNFRLASRIINSRKGNYDDVLDPFEVETGWFHLELVTGRIFPAPGLNVALAEAVQRTIDRLGLDRECERDMRARHYQEYCERKYTTRYLADRSPLVFAEARRQGLLALDPDD